MTLSRIAIVGTGPAGMYAAQHLLTQRDVEVRIDLFDRLPTPWGLVRAGVAPDHPEKKSIADRLFRQLLTRPEVRFYGNVEIGRTVSIDELRQHYQGVIIASGAAGDVPLAIPGADLPGAFSARQFVAWYNGHPDYRSLDVDLSCCRAVIIGNGNVALDAARILMTPVARLERSDIAEHALAALRRSAIEEVMILGRRGAEHVAFNAPEFEELLELADVSVSVEGDEIPEVGTDQASTRKMALLQRVSQTRTVAAKRIRFCFYRVPVAITGNARVEAIHIAATRLARDDHGIERCFATDEQAAVEAGLVLSAIGYRAQPFPGLPFDIDRGVIPSEHGRVLENGNSVPGIYVTGWVRRGARGIIGTNKKCAVVAVAALLGDLAAGRLARPCTDDDAIDRLLAERGARVVDREAWLRIDRAERQAGRERGRERCKFTAVEAMLQAGQVP